MELNEHERRQVAEMIDQHCERVLSTVRATEPPYAGQEEAHKNIEGLMRSTAMMFAALGARIRYVTMTTMKSSEDCN